MFVASLILIVSQAEPAVAAPVQDAIVVLGQRLRTVRWTYDAGNGELVRCTIRRSGGLVADALVCEASRQCVAENPKMGPPR